jgi:putative flippase GtrA
MAARARRMDWRWMRYVMASVAALATDVGLFLALLASGMTAIGASATGYCTGIIVHWLISSRIVFADGAAQKGSGERTRQKALFVGSALVGLIITMAIVGGGDAISIDPRLAKLVAIIVAFQTTYMLRRHIVFRA